MTDSLKEYKTFVVAHLRELEVRRANNDSQKIKQLEQQSDDDLLKKWLWIVSIVGGIVCFLILPLSSTVLLVVVPAMLMELFWTILRFLMGVVLIFFCLAIYLTVKKTS